MNAVNENLIRILDIWNPSLMLLCQGIIMIMAAMEETYQYQPANPCVIMFWNWDLNCALRMFLVWRCAAILKRGDVRRSLCLQYNFYNMCALCKWILPSNHCTANKYEWWDNKWINYSQNAWKNDIRWSVGLCCLLTLHILWKVNVFNVDKGKRTL